ncbi:Conserved_hypothetical protein [Hexamita inflata]|uniref:Uncharacterized protein n=1 Tax=Hexamita inflata TaxID=28002 RepID=A0AA86U4L9_9EUKA|nr:Conserved hypothetical protein [Hexamita inflata]
MTMQAESEYQHSVNDFQLSFIQVLSDGFSSYGDLFNGLLQQVFDSVEEHFVQRPLYVMFESALNCDPLTDHVVPKNVFPLFRESFRSLEKIAIQQVQQKTASFQNKLTDEILRLSKRAFWDSQLVLDNMHKQEGLIVALNQIQTELNSDTVNMITQLRKQISFMHTQLDQRAVFGQMYKPDHKKGQAWSNFKRFKMQEKMDKENMAKFELQTQIDLLKTQNDELEVQLLNSRVVIEDLENENANLREQLLLMQKVEQTDAETQTYKKQTLHQEMQTEAEQVKSTPKLQKMQLTTQSTQTSEQQTQTNSQTKIEPVFSQDENRYSKSRQSRQSKLGMRSTSRNGMNILDLNLNQSTAYQDQEQIIADILNQQKKAMQEQFNIEREMIRLKYVEQNMIKLLNIRDVGLQVDENNMQSKNNISIVDYKQANQFVDGLRKEQLSMNSNRIQFVKPNNLYQMETSESKDKLNNKNQSQNQINDEKNLQSNVVEDQIEVKDNPQTTQNNNTLINQNTNDNNNNQCKEQTLRSNDNNNSKFQEPKANKSKQTPSVVNTLLNKKHKNSIKQNSFENKKPEILNNSNNNVQEIPSGANQNSTSIQQNDNASNTVSNNILQTEQSQQNKQQPLVDDNIQIIESDQEVSVQESVQDSNFGYQENGFNSVLKIPQLKSYTYNRNIADLAEDTQNMNDQNPTNNIIQQKLAKFTIQFFSGAFMSDAETASQLNEKYSQQTGEILQSKKQTTQIANESDANSQKEACSQQTQTKNKYSLQISEQIFSMQLLPTKSSVNKNQSKQHDQTKQQTIQSNSKQQSSVFLDNEKSTTQKQNMQAKYNQMNQQQNQLNTESSQKDTFEKQYRNTNKSSEQVLNKNSHIIKDTQKQITPRQEILQFSKSNQQGKIQVSDIHNKNLLMNLKLMDNGKAYSGDFWINPKRWRIYGNFLVDGLGNKISIDGIIRDKADKQLLLTNDDKDNEKLYMSGDTYNAGYSEHFNNNKNDFKIQLSENESEPEISVNQIMNESQLMKQITRSHLLSNQANDTVVSEPTLILTNVYVIIALENQITVFMLIITYSINSAVHFFFTSSFK